VGILIFFMLCDYSVGGIFTQRRLRRRRRETRLAQVKATREQRQHERRLEVEELSRAPSKVEYETLPAWLQPLLKNRPVSINLHDEITATATTRKESESMLQTAIDDLETTTVTITTDGSEAGTTPPDDASAVSDQDYDIEYPAEQIIEREAILDLLGALELQYKAGRVTASYHKRKPKQLLDRLAVLS
jgi:hypothetical protein